MEVNESETYTDEDIWYMDGGAVSLSNDYMRRLLSKALSKVPKKVADKTMEECVLAMPTSDEKAFYVPNGVIKDKNLIACPESILEETGEKAIRTILHEVAHHHLRHNSPLLEDLSEAQIEEQEKEADNKVREWLEMSSHESEPN